METKSYLGSLSPEDISAALSLKFNDGSIKGSAKSVIVGKRALMMVMDVYYLRISSNVSVSLLIEVEDNQTKIIAVCSGGATGLLQLTFGSEKNVMKTIDKLLSDFGFLPELNQVRI